MPPHSRKDVGSGTEDARTLSIYANPVSGGRFAVLQQLKKAEVIKVKYQISPIFAIGL